jgi:hypothetical protein
MQHIHTVELSALPVGIVVRATSDEAKQRFQSAHARLHGNFLAGFFAHFWPIFGGTGLRSQLFAGLSS